MRAACFEQRRQSLRLRVACARLAVETDAKASASSWKCQSMSSHPICDLDNHISRKQIFQNLKAILAILAMSQAPQVSYLLPNES